MSRRKSSGKGLITDGQVLEGERDDELQRLNAFATEGKITVSNGGKDLLVKVIKIKNGRYFAVPAVKRMRPILLSGLDDPRIRDDSSSQVTDESGVQPISLDSDLLIHNEPSMSHETSSVVSPPSKGAELPISEGGSGLVKNASADGGGAEEEEEYMSADDIQAFASGEPVEKVKEPKSVQDILGNSPLFMESREDVPKTESAKSSPDDGTRVDKFKKVFAELKARKETVQREWDMARAELETAQTELENLLKKKKSFLDKLNQYFFVDRTEEVSVGSIAYKKDMELGQFEKQLHQLEEHVEELNDMEQAKKKVWEAARDEEIAKNTEWEEYNLAQLSANVQAKRDFVADSNDKKKVLDGLQATIQGDNDQDVARREKSRIQVASSEKRPITLKAKALDSPIDTVKGRPTVSVESESEHVTSLREYLGQMNSAEKKRMRDAQKKIIQYMDSDASRIDPMIRWKRFLDLAREMNLRGSAVLERRGLDFGERLERERDSIVLFILMQAHRERKFDELLSEMERRMNAIVTERA